MAGVKATVVGQREWNTGQVTPDGPDSRQRLPGKREDSNTDPALYVTIKKAYKFESKWELYLKSRG